MREAEFRNLQYFWFGEGSVGPQYEDLLKLDYERGWIGIEHIEHKLPKRV